MKAILPNVSLEKYIRDSFHDGPPSLSASTAHLLLTKSPRHAWLRSAKLNPAWESDASEASDIGTIAHAMFLERDRSRIVVVDALDWRTNAAKAARDAARAAGQLPVLKARMAEVEQMVDAMRDALADSELAGIAVDARIEHTLCWDEAGVRLRCRPDLIDADGAVLLDVKTTAGNAEPDAWSRGPLLSSGYDLQGAMMLRGASAVLGPRERHAVFMVVETEAPFAVSFIGLDPQYVEFANAKLDAAIHAWKHCLDTGTFPGYPTRICWASPPSYAVYAWGERTALASLDNGDGEVSDL